MSFFTLLFLFLILIFYFCLFLFNPGIGRTARLSDEKDWCGVQFFSSVCLSFKFLVDNNELFWQETLQHFDPPPNSILRIPSPDIEYHVRIRDQPETSALNIVSIPNNYHSVGQLTRCILSDKCCLCGGIESEEEEEELLYLGIENALVCLSCLNDVVALDSFTLSLLDKIQAVDIGKGGPKGQAVTSFRKENFPKVKLGRLFQKDTKGSIVLRHLIGSCVASLSTSVLLYSGRCVVANTQKDELKRERLLHSTSSNEKIDTKWNDAEHMSTIKKHSSHPILSTISTEIGSLIELDAPPCQINGCLCRPFIEVWKVLNSTTAYRIAVVKHQPSNFFALALRQFNKIKKEQIKLQLLQKKINPTEKQRTKTCIIPFNALKNGKVVVRIRNGTGFDVLHGTFKKASFDTLTSDLLLDISIRRVSEAGQKKNPFEIIQAKAKNVVFTDVDEEGDY